MIRVSGIKETFSFHILQMISVCLIKGPSHFRFIFPLLSLCLRASNFLNTKSPNLNLIFLTLAL